MYLPIGQNSFCIESILFASIPSKFDDQRLPTISSHKRGAKNQLDADDGGIVENNGHYTDYNPEVPLPMWAVTLIIVAIAIILTGAVMVLCIICQKRVRMHQQNVQ